MLHWVILVNRPAESIEAHDCTLTSIPGGSRFRRLQRQAANDIRAKNRGDPSPVRPAPPPRDLARVPFPRFPSLQPQPRNGIGASTVGEASRVRRDPGMAHDAKEVPCRP